MLIKGKQLAENIVEKIKSENFPELTLSVFHPVGDAAAESYLKAKERWLGKVGFVVKVIPVSNKMSEGEFFTLLERENRDDSVHAIMVELPLPIPVKTIELQSRINPLKDVDGITFENQGKFISTGKEEILPCTAMGAAKLLESVIDDVTGKNVLVIGRSNIVGLPLFKLFLNRNATVTVAHSRTKELEKLVNDSDIVAVAVGRHGIIQSSWVQDGKTVIDIGINVNEEGKLKGDMKVIDKEEKKRINYSPVPGGSGSVTNAVLLENIVKCYELQKKGKR